MARAAGVAAIGVAWGYHDPVHLRAAGAHHVAVDANDLAGVLDGYMGELRTAVAP
jgi:phosphoglycolate phosphatase